MSPILRYLTKSLVAFEDFTAFPMQSMGNMRAQLFFEVLTEGNDLALLCREYVATDTRGMNYWGPMGMNPLWGPQNSFGYRLAFNYYFFKNGRLQRYSLKKKDLFALLPGYDDEIDLFMRKKQT